MKVLTYITYVLYSSYKLNLNIKKKKLPLLKFNEVRMSKKRDWTPAKIKYELAKQGLTLYAVSLNAGLHKRACSNAAQDPHVKGELAISEALGIHPSIIWPSRYTKDGERLKPQPSRNYNWYKPKSNIQKEVVV